MHETTTASPQLSELVASEIRAELGRRGITQSTLAARLGETETWLSRRVNAGSARKTPLDLNDLERIAASLDLTVGDLVERATRVAA